MGDMAWVLFISAIYGTPLALVIFAVWFYGEE